MKILHLIQKILPGVFPMIASMVYAQNSKPNIVFILADDLGWADLPVYGNSFNEAPNIDRLASEGIRFTNAANGN